MSAIEMSTWSCPLPLRDYPRIVIGHGGGGALSSELIEHLFLPAFTNSVLASLGDSAVLTMPAGRLAFSTDSYVVQPLCFPGGDIGTLAVYGTVNDLAMSGATPLYLSAGFILEEGLSMETLAGIAASMGQAARVAGIKIVAGDTKVVDRGHGDGVFINTAGIGVIADGVRIAPNLARPGDIVIVSGTIGDHGMAIMSVRAGIEFATTICSDTAPLNGLVAAMLTAAPDIHVLRDPTRGGVATALNEIAARSGVGIVLEERHLPVNPEVQSACELLGLDPLYVANEGKLLTIVRREAAEVVLAAMRAHPIGQRATIIGEVYEQHSGLLLAKTAIGGTRVIPTPIGEQLPRIC